MATDFTYVLTTNLGKLRLKLGDTEEGKGVRPRDRNFTDSELQVFLDEGGGVDTAWALACEVLATEWRKVANITAGPRSEQLGAIAQGYQDQADSILKNRASGGFRLRPAASRENQETVTVSAHGGESGW